MIGTSAAPQCRRTEHGSIDFDLPEPVIEFDEEQRMTTITRSEQKHRASAH